jgi:hypothetical protein
MAKITHGSGGRPVSGVSPWRVRVMNRSIRLLMGLTVCLLVAGSVVPVASAAAPTRWTDSFSFEATIPSDFPAICDFTYHQAVSVISQNTAFSDGRVEAHALVTTTHTNLSTGYALSDSDRFNTTAYPDGTFRVVGVWWHIRDANGKLVVHQAGQLVYDPNGNVIKFTPNINADFAAVICPALGGAVL